MFDRRLRSVVENSPDSYCGNVPVAPLTIVYLLVFFIAVFARDSYAENNTLVFIVVALLLFAGLGLWVYSAQKNGE